jgi:hypothetical protein
MTRDQQLALIYRHTSRDYKGKLNGEKSVLVNINGATCLVLLKDLTDADIERKLPYALQQEAKRLGTLARKNGRKCVPAHDAALLALTRVANPSGEIGHPMTVQILDAWSRAWHTANLAS